jgi:hypothetical protein
VAVLAVIVALGLGCATFKSKEIPAAEGLKAPPTAVKKRVSYAFTAGFDYFGKKEEIEQERRLLDDRFLAVLVESGYFTVSHDRKEKADLVMELRMERTESLSNTCGCMWTFLSAMTFTIIPSWSRMSYDLAARVRTGNGKVNEYRVKDSAVQVIWLPMALAAPFRWPKKVTAEVHRNIYRTLLVRMKADGLLE